MKSGCKNPILPGNHSILNNKCSQQNIFTPRPSPNSNRPEIGRFSPNGADFSCFRSGLAATRPQKFILFAGNIRFVAGRYLLLSIIPLCYIHSTNNGRSTIFHIWKCGGQGGVPPWPPKSERFWCSEVRVSHRCSKKADRALQYTIIKCLGPMRESYPPEKNPGFGGQGGGRRDPPDLRVSGGEG